MKKVFLISRVMLLTLCVGLASCAKNPEISDKSKEMVPVSFKVGFSKEVTNFRSLSISRSETEPMLNKLTYLVYDNNTGQLYKQLEKYDFEGAISDELPEGNYTFVFVGERGTSFYYDEFQYWEGRLALEGNKIQEDLPFVDLDFYDWEDLHYNNSSFELKFSYINDENIDIFYAKYNYEVQKEATLEKDIALDRIIGKIEVVIEDAIPNNVAEITMELINTPVRYYYSKTSDMTVRSGSSYEQYLIEESEKGTTGYALPFISFENINADQSRYSVSIKLTAKKSLPEGVQDNGQSVVATKTIENVDILKNKTVIYRGNLFDGVVDPGDDSGSASFSFSVNDNWNEDVEKTY